MRFLTLFTVLILACCSYKLSSQTSPEKSFYPDQLNFGSYNVGFKTLWTYDITRTAVPYTDWDGRLYGTAENQGRQFQINLWYPAETTDQQEPMKLKSYMDLSYRQINYSETVNTIAFGQKEFVNKLNALRGKDSLTRETLDKLEPLSVRAVNNAPAINQRFPVIVYPNGMAPVANSTTAEFLASYGYVVIAFAVKGENGSTIDSSTKGAELAADDIGFVLSEVLALPFVDKERIGLMGNAIESSFCIAYLCKNQNIDAYVSLEGGFISNFEQAILKELPFYEPSSIEIPLLMIYSPHPSIKPAAIEHLVYAKRYFAHLPGMHEFEYLNFGLFNQVVPNLIGQPRGDIAEGFTAAHLLIKRYFDVRLKDSEADFDKEFMERNSAAIDTTFIWQAIPNLPPLTNIKNQFLKSGLPFLDSLYSLQKKYTTTPFSPQFLIDFTDWVAWKKDPEYTTRRWLMQKAVEDYPTSALYSYYLARYAQNSGDSQLAKEQFRAALEKLKTDPDEQLTAAQKAQIKERALEELDRLK